MSRIVDFLRSPGPSPTQKGATRINDMHNLAQYIRAEAVRIRTAAVLRDRDARVLPLLRQSVDEIEALARQMRATLDDCPTEDDG